VSEADEAIVRRYYQDFLTDKRTETLGDLISETHRLHDPQIRTLADISMYRDGIGGPWTIEEIFSTDDRVIVRWIRTGSHVDTINGIPATGQPIRSKGICIHRMEGGRIAETWEVFDALGVMQQIGSGPA